VTAALASIVARVTEHSAADETVTDADETADEVADETVTDADETADEVARARVSRWDRPPAPRDWRFYVGNLGRVLITTGLLMFGFVAYQLWGTGIETARSQNRLEHQFETLLTETTYSTPDITTDATVDEGTASGAEQSTDDPTPTTPETTAGDADVPVAVDLSDQAVVQEPVPIERGEVLARLEIPRIGATDYVVPGVTLEDLKKGPGHYPDTPLPGQLGNTAVAGHRTTYGAPFFDIDQLEAGDELIFTMVNGDRFVYLVTFSEVVSASDYGVVTTTDPNIAEATLTSCHPKYTARDRIVVHSVLDPERSSKVGIPTFYELDTPSEPDDAALTGDDPVLSTDGVDAPETGEATSESTSDVDRTAEQPSGEAIVDEPADGRADDPEPIDAFSRGWFGDRGAFPQIGLWGAALIAIALLAYRVAKRFRRYSIGLLVGVVPFVIALYFFYQNVNRLLPPGI
jgi:sortase A